MCNSRICCLVLVLSVTLAAGCNRSKAVPRAVPPAKSSTAASEEKPPAPPPEPEPAPGEGVRLTLPADGGKWPWPVGKAEDSTAEVRPISFPGLPAYAVTGLVARPDVNRAIVSIKNEKKGQPATTRFVLCDTSTGKTITEWLVNGIQSVLDLSPDAHAFLSTSSQPGSRDRTVLRLWLIGSDAQLRRSAWSPHIPRLDGIRQDAGELADPLEVRWAAFAGNDRVVSSSKLGQLRIFDTETAKPLYSLEGSPGRPALTPDGSKVAILIGTSVALIDPVAGAVIGVRPVGSLPPYPALAFSPDGSKLVVGGNGKAVVMDLAGGEIRTALLPRLHVTDTGYYDKPFGFARNAYLFADGKLHDLRFPAPVWEYTGVEGVQFLGGRVWACSRAAGSSTVTLAEYTLPHGRAATRLIGAQARPGVFALSSGDGVRIDVSGVPDDHKAEAQTALEQRLKAAGYRPDPAAPAVLFASVDMAGTKASVSYSGYDPLFYTRRAAQLRLMVNSKDVWTESWAIEPPLIVRLAAGVALSDHFKPAPFGDPDYKLFSQAPLPSAVPASAAAANPLGTSELTADKLRGWLVW